MKRNWMCTIGLVLLLLQPAAAQPLPVWELQGQTNRVLLMGSIHFLREQDYPLRDGLLKAYELADTLVMELDPDAMTTAELQAVVTELAVDPQGRQLMQLLSPAGYRQAQALALDLELPLLAFSAFEPWFAALSITQLRMQQLGFDPQLGLEAHLLQRAKADGKPVRGLESFAEQLTFLDELDAQTQEQFLLQSLDEAASVERELESIVTAWQNGDSAALEQLLLDGIRDVPALYDALLVQRNRNWVPAISALLGGTDNYLVIVGALHLVGPDSVQALLQQAGISSRQLGDAELAPAATD